MTDRITLTRSESATILDAFARFEAFCDRLRNAGATSRVRPEALLADAIRAAKKDAPDSVPKLACARVDVLRAIRVGIENPPSLATLAGSSAWYLQAVALGALVKAEADRFEINHSRFNGDVESACRAYEGARDRWLNSWRS